MVGVSGRCGLGRSQSPSITQSYHTVNGLSITKIKKISPLLSRQKGVFKKIFWGYDIGEVHCLGLSCPLAVPASLAM
jgi:hypothetical protein